MVESQQRFFHQGWRKREPTTRKRYHPVARGPRAQPKIFSDQTFDLIAINRQWQTFFADSKAQATARLHV